MFTTGTLLAILPFGGIGTSEMIIIGVIAVLLFGKRLPEVGRSLGKSLVEFKKGMQGIESEIRSATAFDTNTAATPRKTPKYNDEDRSDPSVPRFEPPPAADLAGADAPKFEPPSGEPQLN